MKNKPKTPTKNKTVSTFKAIGTSTVSGLIVWTILLFVASYIISKLSGPENFIIPAVFILAAVSSLVSGIVCTKMMKKRSLLPGLISAGVLILLVFILSVLCAGNEGAVSAPLKALICVDFIAFSLLGAKLAVPGAPKRRKSRR